ncbi:LysR family transcriptional regulator [Nocardioides sp. Kera G14]|uniref:LysR family transcriptional regulator n=1 Tax=Nocardioides sp. Kera G14 TaxID=2884264 RepID=UPI001D12B11E|nr:LysR family transcriptional regulator [Nocardioides sp. Kera G14]UDY23509.1 LysR family transcriptional regulator [Nocardioides sp. Kera G14]
MLDVRRLRLLRELSIHGTLAEVAEVLHQSPSSVSQQLALLEREAGVELLRKSGRRVELTPAAELLVDHAGQILTLLEQAEAAVAALADEVSGTVQIAAFQSAALAFMPQLLTRLATEHPRLRVTMSQRLPEEALLEARSNEVDLVIAQQYPHHPAPLHAELDRAPLTTDRLRLAVPPHGSRWEAIDTLADAAGVPWVMEPRGAASRQWTEHLCREAGFEPDVRFETDDLEAHIALVETGNAVVVLPDLMSVRRPPAVRWVDLPGDPRREVFTSTRAAIAGAPPIVACRQALAEIVPAELPSLL